MATPQFVKDIFEQLGQGLRGGYVYVGGHNPTYGTEPNPFVRFDVNGKRGENWKMVIEVDPSDTYNVSLVNKAGKKLATAEDVYCDNLQGVCEDMYDRAIDAFNGGYINI